jgi:hypothetical protein
MLLSILTDHALSKAFSVVVAAAAAWTIWGGDMFPPEPDPTGDPEGWTNEEMRRWLSLVSDPRHQGLSSVWKVG